MPEHENGGPAHPDPGSSGWGDSHGMSLRDYFKSRAISAIVPTASNQQQLDSIEALVDQYASVAGKIADAMIRETKAFYA